MAKKPEQPTKKDYRLHRGTHSYVNEDGDRVEAQAGDTVPLTDEQYKNFIDKFEDPKAPKERVSVSGAPVPTREYTEPADNAQLKLHNAELNARVIDPTLGSSSEPTTPGLVGKEEGIQDKKDIDPLKTAATDAAKNAKVTKDEDDKANAAALKGAAGSTKK